MGLFIKATHDIFTALVKTDLGQGDINLYNSRRVNDLAMGSCGAEVQKVLAPRHLAPRKDLSWQK